MFPTRTCTLSACDCTNGLLQAQRIKYLNSSLCLKPFPCWKGCRSAQGNAQLPGVLEKKLHWKESWSFCLAFLAPGVTSKYTPLSWVPEELPGPSMVFAPTAFPTELLPECSWGLQQEVRGCKAGGQQRGQH